MSTVHIVVGALIHPSELWNFSSLPQDPVKALPEVGVEDLPARGFHQVFLTPNTFGFLPSQRIQLTTGSAPFYPSVQDIWLKDRWYDHKVHLWPLAQMSSNRMPIRFRSGRPFLPITQFQVALSLPTWVLKSSSRMMVAPASSTPPNASKQAECSALLFGP